MVVALELAHGRGSAGGHAIVELDDRIARRSAMPQRTDLDDRVRAHRLEAVDLAHAAGGVGAHELVRRAAAGQTQIRRRDRNPPVAGLPGRRREHGLLGPAQREALMVDNRDESQGPAGNVDIVAGLAQPALIRACARDGARRRGAALSGRRCVAAGRRASIVLYERPQPRR